jgi:hypothetical protein
MHGPTSRPVGPYTDCVAIVAPTSEPADLRRQPTATVATEVLAYVAAAVGPVGMGWAGYGDHPERVALITLVASLAIGALTERRHVHRLLVAVAAGTVVGISDGQLLGLWVLAGLALADWSIRLRRPAPSVPAPDGGARAPVLAILTVAAWGASQRTMAYGPVAPVLAAAIVTGAMCWSVLRTRRFAPAAPFAALVMVISSWRGSGDYPLTLATLPRIALAVVAAAVLAWGAEQARRVDGREPCAPGWSRVALWTAPGLLWWMVNSSIWFWGALDSGHLGHRSWQTGATALPTYFLEVDGLFAAPVWILTFLVLGGAMAVAGRSVVRPASLVAVVSTLLALAVTAVWFAGGDVG